jgi:nickel-dependent lactate racemase
MDMTEEGAYQIPLGTGRVEFHLPKGMRGKVVRSRHVAALDDVSSAIAQALARPIQSPPVEELVGPGKKVCIAFTDVTRASPDHLLVPPILYRLEKAGVRRQDITLLCALGLHRPSTHREKEEKLGKRVVEGYRVVDHDPRDPAALVDLGKTAGGIPLSVNRIAHEADLLIATGIVEPHQYAGYSGGPKTVAIGVGGEPLIAYTHGPAMVDHPGTRLGKVAGNPFQEAVTEAAARAGLRFIVNVVQDDQQRPVAVYAGEPRSAFQKLVDVARQCYEVPISRQYDIAVAGVGFPKDQNLYQATRAVSYLFFAPTCVVKEGGVFILPAPTPEGAGEGVGEQRFLETMEQAADMSSLLDQLRETGYPPGAQRAFIMAKVLEKHPVIVVGSQRPDLVEKLHMVPVRTMEDALEKAAGWMGDAALDVLVVPHALLTLPVVSG